MDWVSILEGFVIVGLVMYFWLQRPGSKCTPPGPKAFPIVGNFSLLGKKPHIAMLRWKEKYGDTYLCYAGRKPVLVLSSFHTVKKLFSDDIVAGRDQQSPIKKQSAVNAIGLVKSEGDLWKTHRRFALTTLRDLGMGKNWLEESIIAEVEGLCERLRNFQGKPVNPKHHLTNSVSNVICALIFGKRFDLDDPVFSRLTQGLTKQFEDFATEKLAASLKFLMWFPNPVRRAVRRARANLQAQEVFVKDKIREHGEVPEKSTIMDYVSAYQAAEAGGIRSGFTHTFDEKQLVASLMDLFAAGTETVATTIMWSFVFLFENPDVLKKVQEEIDHNVGHERILTNADRVLLPYTEAAVLEVQRCASLVPLGIPHRNWQEITVDGYTIPKDTVIVANLFSIHRDPRWWTEPEKFDPHRFLDNKMKLIRPDGFAPFLIGKRACLGEALAKMELFLFIANLLRCFTLELPPGEMVSHNDYVTSVVHSPNPFKLKFIRRDVL